MKRKVSKKRKNIVTISILVLIILGIFLFYTRNILLISSCTGLVGKGSDQKEPMPVDTIISGTACPGIPIEDYPADSQSVDPPTPGSTNPPSSGSSSSSPSSDSSGLPSGAINTPANNSENKSGISLSPSTIQKNNKNTNNSISVSINAIIKRFISDNNIILDCIRYNESTNATSYSVIIEGHRTSKLLWFQIKIPIEAQLIIYQDKIILECTKYPWWGYFFR